MNSSQSFDVSKLIHSAAAVLHMKKVMVVGVAFLSAACLPPTNVFNPESGTAFQTNTAVVEISGLEQSTAVCYTTDGTDPQWNSGACSGSSQRIAGPVSSAQITISCGSDTGANVRRTVKLAYDWQDQPDKTASAEYFLNCGNSSSGSGGDTATSTNSLQSNEQIITNEYLESSNGQYRLFMQSDGNLVLRNWVTRESLWSTGTHGTGAVRFRLQGDGNLVVRDAAGSAIWSSRTNGTGATRLVLNNDGSLALYAGQAVVWSVNGSGQTGGGTDGGGNTGGGGTDGTGGGNTGGGGDNGGTANSLDRFSAPSDALYSLNDSRPRAYPRHINTNFNGNGHSETWDGRVFVIKRTGGWYAAAFRPERIGRNSDGTPIMTNGAFGNRVVLELESDAPNVHLNWIALVPDPDVTGENPFPSNASGSYRADGTHRTYRALAYHTSNRNMSTCFAPAL